MGLVVSYTCLIEGAEISDRCHGSLYCMCDRFLGLVIVVTVRYVGFLPWLSIRDPKLFASSSQESVSEHLLRVATSPSDEHIVGTVCEVRNRKEFEHECETQ